MSSSIVILYLLILWLNQAILPVNQPERKRNVERKCNVLCRHFYWTIFQNKVYPLSLIMNYQPFGKPLAEKLEYLEPLISPKSWVLPKIHPYRRYPYSRYWVYLKVSKPKLWHLTLVSYVQTRRSPSWITIKGTWKGTGTGTSSFSEERNWTWN